MNIFQMKGKWSGRVARLYDAVVAEGLDEYYDGLVGFFFADLPASGRLLDVGCGSGQVAHKIALLNSRTEVRGVDLSQQQISRARIRGKQTPNLSFSVADAMKLPFPDEEFDIALSVASIKHWPDPIQGLKQMKRVCNPGGKVFVIEADSESTVEETRKFVGYWKHVLPGTRPVVRWYFHRFVAGQGISREELAVLLTQAGLSEVVTQKVPGEPLIIGMGMA